MRPVKRCSRCGEYKPIDDFRITSRVAWCKLCERAYQKEYKTTTRGREIINAAKRKCKALRCKEDSQGMYHPVGKVSPCDSCSSRWICKIEIRRPTFNPPCFAESRFYDPALAGRKGEMEAKGLRV